MEPELILKSCTTISSSSIDCLAYVPSNSQHRRSTAMSKDHRVHDEDKDPLVIERHPHDYAEKRNVHSLLDIDSSDDEDNTSSRFPSDDLLSLHGSEPRTSTWTLRDNPLADEQQQYDTRQATMWISNCQRGSVRRSSLHCRSWIRCPESSSILVLNPCQRYTRNIAWSNNALLQFIPSCSFPHLSSPFRSLYRLH